MVAGRKSIFKKNTMNIELFHYIGLLCSFSINFDRDTCPLPSQLATRLSSSLEFMKR